MHSNIFLFLALPLLTFISYSIYGDTRFGLEGVGLMSSKVLSQVPAEDTLKTSYDNALQSFNKGVENNIYETGSQDEKRGFFQAMFQARVDGVALHKRDGHPYDIPTMDIGGDAEMRFGIEQSSLEMDPNQVVLGSMKPVNKLSRYEQAVNALGSFEESHGADGPNVDY